MKRIHNIAGIGEILWDMFPDGERLGGAPTNFAFHSFQLGGNAAPVSCVGNDQLGDNTITALNKLGVSVKYVQVSKTHPTGRVQVTLDQHGKPSYNILDNMAWDHLNFTVEMNTLAHTLDAVCFGSLSQRSHDTRGAIQSLVKAMPTNSLKILDVNLRAPFFSKDLVESSLQLANVLKLSDEELPVLATYFDLSGRVTDQLAELQQRFDLKLVAYTKGADGSILVSANEIEETAGVEITPVDSVGAGDSFTAALCTGLLKGWSLSKVNQFANQVASYVCSQKGATPELPSSLTQYEIAS